MSYIIGVSGKARSGKDFFATELHKYLPNSKLYSFANALKCYCRVTGLMTVKDGVILQTVGTDVYRAKDKHFWVKMLSYQIEEEKPDIAIITDVRFLNEIMWIEDQGGCTVRMKRFDEFGIQYYSPDRPKDHPSEIALDDYPFDTIISAASGDVDYIKKCAQKLADKITHEIEFT